MCNLILYKWWQLPLFPGVGPSNQHVNFNILQSHACDPSCCLCGVVAVTFGNQAISECSYYTFLVFEQTGRTSFSDLQCHRCDESCCLNGIVFVTFLTQIFCITTCILCLPKCTVFV